MDTERFDPPITHFVVFSGGGGLVERRGSVALAAGESILAVAGVPASFDPDSFLADVTDGVALREIVVKKPNRKYVEDILEREGTAARKLIDGSSEVGGQRSQIIEICEGIAQRTYLDEEVELSLWLETDAAREVEIKLSYFIDDARFSWKPTLTAELGPDDTVRVRGHIAISNQSAHRLRDVEVSFADFARELGDDAQNFRAPPKARKKHMKNRMLKKMLYK